MKVTVQYAGPLREAAARAAETVELARPCTVGDLLRILAERHGERFRSVSHGASGRPALLAVIGDAQVRWDDPRTLSEGDVVSLLAPISGG